MRALLLFLTAIAMAAAQTVVRADQASEKVIGGPYVVNAGDRSGTVTWVVEEGQVSIGENPEQLSPNGPARVKTAPALRAERVQFSGLKPGTRYYYQAFPGEEGKGSFKTAAPKETTKYEFVAFGDTRTRHDVHRAVIQGILKFANPDFVLHSGDLVENGTDTSLWPIFFDVERELLRKAAFYPVLGNHERHAGNYGEYMDVKPYYSFNWGNAHFIAMDTDIGSSAPSREEQAAYWAAETKWLEEDLKKSQGATFRFVFGHHPPMTAVKRRQGDNQHMTALEPMFEKYKVQACFFGHDHNYQHYLKDGVHYFVSGGGGAPLYDVDSPPAGITVKVESTENFLKIDVDGSVAHVVAMKPTGEKIDAADIGQ